jgi:flagellar hook-associated protein 1 FlgK
VTELNKIVGVEVSVQDSGTYNISFGNGYSLVQGSKANQLAAVKSSADPARTTVAYVDDVAGTLRSRKRDHHRFFGRFTDLPHGRSG